MNRTLANAILKDVKEAMELIEKKHNVKLQKTTGSFDEFEFTTRLKFVSTDNEDELFKLNAMRVGVTPDIHNKVFVLRGESYQVTGINVKAQKYPIIAKNLNGSGSIKLPGNSGMVDLILGTNVLDSLM